MKYGFIYQIFRLIVEGIRLVSLVELFKVVGGWMNPKPKDEEFCKTYTRTAVDLFILLKWGLLLLLFAHKANGTFSCLLMWYLIITNLHTYFYYHVWNEKAITSGEKDEHALRRRFMHLLLAMSFSNLSFALLYYTCYANEFNLSGEGIEKIQAIWFSISNSVAANYDVISLKTDLGNKVAMIQLIFTFIFVTIIVSRSIPEKN